MKRILSPVVEVFLDHGIDHGIMVGLALAHCVSFLLSIFKQKHALLFVL